MSVLCFVSGAILVTAVESSPFIVDRWDESHGFPGCTVNDIKQTSDGFLWFATANGLYRYDGFEFERILISKVVDSPAISNPVRSLYVSKDNRLYIGTYAGLHIYENGGVRLAEGTEKIFGISGGVEDQYGRMWVTTLNGGVWCLAKKVNENGQGEMQTTIYKEIPIATAILEDRRGTLWVGAYKDGLMYFQNGAFHRYDLGTVVADQLVLSLYEDGEGILWVGTNDGLVRMENPLQPKGRKLRCYTTADGLADNRITAILRSANGDMWVGTWKGTCQLEFDNENSIITGSLHDSSRSLALYEDKENSMWLGTYCEDLKRLRRSTFYTRFIGSREFSPHRPTLFKSRSGTVWVGWEDGRLVRLKGKDARVLLKENDSTKKRITALEEDRDGRLWVGTAWDGLYKMMGDQWENVVCGEIRKGDFISHLYCDDTNRLWVGSNGLVSIQLPNGAVRRYTESDGLPSTHIRLVFQDNETNLWVCTNQGTVIYKNGRVAADNCKIALKDVCFRAAYIDKDEPGVIWLGSDRNGILRYRDGGFFRFTEKHGLWLGIVGHIIEDDLGYLWLSTPRKLVRISKAALNEMADGRGGKEVPVKAFDRKDGIAVAEFFYNSANSAIKTDDGELWFSSKYGVPVVKPGAIVLNKVPPPVVLKDVRIDGVRVNALESGQIFTDVKHVRFGFSGLTFIDNKWISFAFMLEGYDTKWRGDVFMQSRTISYRNLPPGDYTFKLMAANRNGVWNPIPASFAFTIKPLFYQRTWVKIFAVLLLVVVVAGSYWGFKKYRYLKRIESKYEKSTLDPDSAEQHLRKLLLLVETKKLYLDDALSLQSLAKRMGISAKHLSQLVNERLDKNFSDFINYYRIEEAKKMLTASESASVLDVCYEVGFNSKTPFYRAFKKFTGKTPTEYKNCQSENA